MGASTNYAFPWPESTDVPDGPVNIQSLANKIDSVVFSNIWTNLNNRVTTLENRAPANVPGTQYGHNSLANNLVLTTAWQDVISTGPLVAGTWLIVLQTETDTAGIAGASAITIRLRNVTTGGTAAAKTLASRTEIATGTPGTGPISFYGGNASLMAIVSGGVTFTLQAITDNSGQAQLRATTKYGGNEGNATRMNWVKVA